MLVVRITGKGLNSREDGHNWADLAGGCRCSLLGDVYLPARGGLEDWKILFDCLKGLTACISLSSWEGGGRCQESAVPCSVPEPAVPASTRHDVLCYGAKSGKTENCRNEAVFKELRIKPCLDHQHIIKAVFKMKRRDILSPIFEL